MSHYSTIAINIKDTNALVQALEEMNPQWQGHVIVSSEAQTLYDYHGHARPQKANVIIRRQYVNSASNDIGFVRNSDGGYNAILSDYDQSIGYDRVRWLGKLTQLYGKNVAIKQAEADGMTVVSSGFRNDGTLELVLEENSGY